MGLESASFVNGLNLSNPADTDPRSQGDDHLRLIKAVLLATFPNLNAAVTASPADLNLLDPAPASHDLAFRSTANRKLDKVIGLRFTNLGTTNTPTIDGSVAQVHKVTINANATLTFTNPEEGSFGVVLIENAATSGRTISFAGGAGVTVYKIYTFSSSVYGTSDPQDNSAVVLYFCDSASTLYAILLTNF
jgi:hypothetical protein